MTHEQRDTVNHNQALPWTTSRRGLLRAGGLGLLGATVLAACGPDNSPAGISGAAKTTTIVAPTIPATEPSELALAEDVVQFSTAASIELLVAEAYGTYGPKLSTAELRSTAADFKTAHDAAATAIRRDTTVNDLAGQPNAGLKTNLVEPVAATLINDTAILAFMAALESTLVATYLNAVGILTGAAWRQRVMTFGAAGARRVAVLGGTPARGAPAEALYPLADLIPSSAFVGRAEEKTG